MEYISLLVGPLARRCGRRVQDPDEFPVTRPHPGGRVVRASVEDASDDVLLAVPCANEDAGAG